MVPSLQNLCGVPALVVLLNHPRSKREIFSLSKNRENYWEWEEALYKNISNILEDYNPVMKKIIPKHLIPVTGIDMVNFAECMQETFNLSVIFCQNTIKSSIFTSNGLIDEQKAARELVKEPSFSTFLKYNIACEYFLQDIVPGLWQELQNNEPNFKKMIHGHNSKTPMVLWSEYLEDISRSPQHHKVRTRKFKEKIFSYGLKHKNFAAVKYSFGSKEGSRKDVKIIRNRVYKFYCNYLSSTLKRLESDYRSIDSHSSHVNYLADYKIIMHFLRLVNKRKFNLFFKKFNFSYQIIRWLLFLPYQYQFMDFAEIVYENFGVEEYYALMVEIIFLFNNDYISEYYDYHLLLSEFWIKSPAHLKKQIMVSESGIIQKADNETVIEARLLMEFFDIDKFKNADLEVLKLILESANLNDKKNMLPIQGQLICLDLIFSGKFRLANLFLETMDLDQETVDKFKKDFLLNFFDDVMKKRNIELAEKIFEWVVGNDEISDFKDEFFHRLTHSNKIEHLFVELKEETPFSFLNNILQWFLKPGQSKDEFQKNIEYSPLMPYKEPKWLDQLLKFRGYSNEQASNFKRELLHRSLPEIAKLSFDHTNEIKFKINILFLCLFEKEKLTEFLEHLSSFYEHSIKEDICLFCLNKNLVHDNGEGELHCEEHGTEGFIFYDEIDDICNSYLKKWVNYMNDPKRD